MPAFLPLVALLLAFIITFHSSVLILLGGLALSFFMLCLSLMNTFPKLRQKLFRASLFLCLTFLFSLRISYLDDWSAFKNSPLKAKTEALQSGIIHRLQATKLSPKTQRLALAMALGHIERDEEGQAIRQEFVGSGVAHILAVSGFHLALVTGLIALLISPLPYRGAYKRLKLLILFLATWLFVLLTGSAPATLRAGFMLSLYLFGLALERPVSMLNILALSLLVQLLLVPSLIVSAGFWLSHIAVLSIYLFFQKVYGLVPHISFRPLRYAWESFALTLSVQILILPLCFYFFGGLSWAFLFTALPMTLLATLFIPLSLLLFSLNAFGFNPNFLENCLNFLGELMSKLTHFASSLDCLYQEAELPLWGLLLYYALIALLIILLRRRSKRRVFSL